MACGTIRLGLFVLIALLTSGVAAAQLAFPLDVTVTTGRLHYNLGEEVPMWMQLCNPSNQPVVVWAGNCCLKAAYRFEVVDETDQVVATWDDDDLCMTVPCDFTWDPLSCKLAPEGGSARWNQRVDGWTTMPGDQVPPGWYRVRASWYHDAYVYYSQPFEILAAGQRYPVPAMSPTGTVCLVTLILLAGIAFTRMRMGG